MKWHGIEKDLSVPIAAGCRKRRRDLLGKHGSAHVLSSQDKLVPLNLLSDGTNVILKTLELAHYVNHMRSQLDLIARAFCFDRQ